MKRTIILLAEEQRRRAQAVLSELKLGWSVTFAEPTRTLQQNAAQWPYLQAFSEQLQWPVNGKLTHLEPEEWKDLLSAAFHSETVRLAQGLEGGVVMLGLRTSAMSTREFNEWLEFLRATAALRGVKVPAPKALACA